MKSWAKENQQMVLPVPGVGRTLEWWHFQVEAVYGPGARPPVPRELDEDPEERFASSGGKGRKGGGPSWDKLMAEIGFSKVIQGFPKVPAAELAEQEFGFFQSGFGYNTESTGSNTSSRRVENFTHELADALPG